MLHSVTPCASQTHLRTEGSSKYEEVLKAAEVSALSPSPPAVSATPHGSVCVRYSPLGAEAVQPW